MKWHRFKTAMWSSVVWCVLLLFTPTLADVITESVKGSTQFKYNYACSGCLYIIESLESALYNPNDYDVQVRWRLDEKRRVKHSQSEVRIYEELETVCNPGNDPVSLRDGVANEHHTMGYSTSKSYRRACSTFIDTHEEELVSFLRRDGVSSEFCSEIIEACTAEHLLKLYEDEISDDSKEGPVPMKVDEL